MHFFGSERGLLATPTQCGTYPVTSTFAPWDASLGDADLDPVLHPRLRARTARPAPAAQRPFAPSFEAASADNTAGAHTPFALELDAQRRRPEPQRARRHHAAGLLARPSPGIPYCPDAALAAAADSALLGPRRAGQPELPGRHRRSAPRSPAPAPAPTRSTCPGKVYLAGPYKGAPLSLGGDHAGGLRPL